MVKWLIGFIACLVILTLVCWLVLPNEFHSNQQVVRTINLKSLQRGLLDESTWKGWWPGERTYKNDDSVRIYNGYRYEITNKQFSTIALNISKGNKAFPAYINFIPQGTQQVTINAHIDQALPVLPWSRLSTYFAFKQADKDLSKIVKAIGDYYSNNDNIYKIHIIKSLVKDSSLISTNGLTNGYPQPEYIYSLIDKLHQYAYKHGAQVTDYPMLNVYTQDSISFLTRVALPLDKKLPSSGTIEYKWMLGGGNILVADVKGGPASINQAIHQMENYISDYNRVPPAIPFQSLITDRSKEPDSSRWITRVYYPVM